MQNLAGKTAFVTGGASGIGLGNSIARDVRFAEMLIAKNINPSISDLADANIQLKTFLKS